MFSSGKGAGSHWLSCLENTVVAMNMVYSTGAAAGLLFCFDKVAEKPINPLFSLHYYDVDTPIGIIKE